MIQRIPGPVLLWFLVLVFGAAGSVVRILSDLGAQRPIDGRNAILLFAGNACAFVVLYVVHRKKWTREILSGLSGSEWCGLVVVAFLANAIAPRCFFWRSKTPW